MADIQKKNYSIKVVEKALDMLEALSLETDEFSISHLAHTLDISRASAFRLMATFENRGYVEKSLFSNKYRVGITALETSQNILLGLELLNYAKPIMERLARECHEAVYLCVPKQDEILLLDMVTSTHKVQIVSLVGKSYPAKTFAAGKVILAHSENASAESAEFSKIRQRGYCVDQNDIEEGVTCLAVPIFGNKQFTSASLCIIGPTFRMSGNVNHSILLPQLTSAGQIISSKLGYSELHYKHRLSLRAEMS